LSKTIRERVGTWRDGRFGCTLYPYKRTKACVARLRVARLRKKLRKKLHNAASLE
jgi:hypothetical protein